MQGAGGVGGLLAMTIHSGTNEGTYFYCYDGNHSVTALVNATNAAVTAQYEYGPFGEVIRATGPLAFLNPFRFSTKYQDEETAFLYYGYRYYDPSTGRWLSRDPIGELGFKKVNPNTEDFLTGEEENLYSLVRNSPISYFDTLGLFCENPCEEARKKNLHLNPVAAGGVICCQGKKYDCVWEENLGAAKDSIARSIISRCIAKHEADHFDAVVCPLFCERNEATRPPFWPRIDANAEECAADQVEFSCLLSGFADCKGNAQCEQEVKAEMATLIKEMQKLCKGAK